jgi:indole-3-glycerol phosphate synthase/phosphoribosylanthranilate isomerase
MADVLAAIVERKRSDIAARLAGIEPAAATPTTRSLRAALARPGARFIMEVKRASPSGHRGRHDLDAAVAAYAPVADAISVLTDTPFFGGTLDDLRSVRSRFEGPILAKDFVVDPRQVTEARLCGADAVLAMLSVLDDNGARAVLAEADRLGMDVLVEVHDEAEMARAKALGARMVGINNRDLKTLRTDLAVTERLAAGVADDVTLISESGVGSRPDTQRLGGLVDGFLVGSSLMAADDIGEAARALVHGRVKICGLTHADDVRAAGQAGATHAGLIFVPGTPRALEVAAAAPLAQAARSAGMKAVGVFRDSPVTDVLSAANLLGLDVVQLHGREDAPAVAAVQSGFGGEVWTACAPDEDRGGDRPLFDHGAGGTGQPFEWARIGGHPRLKSAFLAGGIDATNARAAQETGVHGIDISSRIEASPGRKDPAKLRALFDVLRTPDRRSSK